MATRNLTNKYESYRQQFKTSRTEGGYSPPAQGAQDNGRTHLLSNVELSEDPGEDSNGHYSLNMAPEWVSIVTNIHQTSAKVNTSLEELQTLYDKRLKVSFGADEEEQDKEIEIATKQLTRYIRSIENNIKRIAAVGNNNTLSDSEKTVRLNAMRNLGSTTSRLSRKFRQMQKDFVHRLKGQEDMNRDYHFDDSDSKKPLSLDDLEKGLSSQMQLPDEMDELASAREQEIVAIAKSINELSNIFKELSVLVIEQGTILDRIDYNVEQSLQKVTQATDQLVKANNISKKARSLKCILFLVVVVIILSSILYVQHKDGKK